MSRLLLVLFSLSMMYCTPPLTNELYKVLPKGEQISLSTLEKCEQIYPTDKGYLLLYNLSTEATQYQPYILACDAQLKLEGAAYFASEFIELFDGNTITGILNQSRASDSKLYQNDLPEDLQIKLYSLEKDNGYQKVMHTIIDSMHYQPKGAGMVMYLRESDNLYAWQGLKHYQQKPDYYKQNFNRDTIELIPLSHLLLNLHQSGMLASPYPKPSKRILREMALIDPDALTKLYKEIWESATQSTR